MLRIHYLSLRDQSIKRSKFLKRYNENKYIFQKRLLHEKQLLLHDRDFVFGIKSFLINYCLSNIELLVI